MLAEPLLTEHSLALSLMAECHKTFELSAVTTMPRFHQNSRTQTDRSHPQWPQWPAHNADHSPFSPRVIRLLDRISADLSRRLTAADAAGCCAGGGRLPADAQSSRPADADAAGRFDPWPASERVPRRAPGGGSLQRAVPPRQGRSCAPPTAAHGLPASIIVAVIITVTVIIIVSITITVTIIVTFSFIIITVSIIITGRTRGACSCGGGWPNLRSCQQLARAVF